MILPLWVTPFGNHIICREGRRNSACFPEDAVSMLEMMEFWFNVEYIKWLFRLPPQDAWMVFSYISLFLPLVLSFFFSCNCLFRGLNPGFIGFRKDGFRKIEKASWCSIPYCGITINFCSVIHPVNRAGQIFAVILIFVCDIVHSVEYVYHYLYWYQNINISVYDWALKFMSSICFLYCFLW